MMYASTQKKASTDETKNIIISGTNFWNPGDDFVRDGVIRVLKELFHGHRLNFIFYNFNEDFLPHTKFKGVSNMLDGQDVAELRDHISAIVIVGLSAGREIKELYNWIIENRLIDRVYLIGAGYENAYVEENIVQEPEATIFKHAKIIIGRTQKKPDFIDKNKLPYHYLNCPAILSVDQVKNISGTGKIGKIGISIQLPREIGIANHSVDGTMHLLALAIVKELYPRYDIEIIAHHKTEYLYFLNHLKRIRIPVLFSSFYQDLYDVYRKYDLVISTRLHACLYANGHGIPAIIINNTDRHTHCANGFPHVRWVDSIERFNQVFDEMNRWNLADTAREAEAFKDQLRHRYLGLLNDAFKKHDPLYQCVWNKERNPNNDSMAHRIYELVAGDLTSRKRVLNIMECLTRDHWLSKNIQDYRTLVQSSVKVFDAAVFLNWYAENFKPRYYLEVGVRRGRSMAQVLCQSPGTITYGFDVWLPEYGSLVDEEIYTRNPGPEFVMEELKRAGVKDKPILIKGRSQETLAKFWGDSRNPQKFDLIFVDGDHGYQGAKVDLDICFDHLSDQGVLLFDDICHPSHPDLLTLWEETKTRLPEFLFIEDRSGMGTGVVFKPPFQRLSQFLDNR